MRRLYPLIVASLLSGAFPAGGQDVIPTPESVLGFVPCAERQLATYEQIADYFRTLDAASERLELREIGKTAEGRTQLLAIISSAENLAALERYRRIAERLARASDLDDAEAAELAREGKAIVWIDFGLHSTERAHAQVAPQMAYQAVTDESAEMQAIRDQVIFLLLPNMNPDGTTLVTEWFRKNRDTPFEETSPPRLYQKYVGHDNNRDWFMFNQPETRNVGRQLYHEWYPQIVYNQHQEAPFPARIFIPPFEDPMNPNIPPLVMRGINLVGEAMSRRLAQEGKSGVLSRVSFDTWWNGGMRTAPYYHNMVGILTETAHSSPATIVYDAERFPARFGNGVSTREPSTFYPDPYRGGEWRFADSCAYMLTASLAVLDIGAKRRQEWLHDIYRMGRAAIEAGTGETYVIPDRQWDRGAARRLVEALRMGGVQIERASEPFTLGGHEIETGAYLIRGSQAFRPYLTDLLNPQRYPDQRLYPGGPPDLPYDITGWTLPLQMGVEVIRTEDAVAVATEEVDWPYPDGGEMVGSGRWGWALDPRSNDSFRIVNDLLAEGAEISRLTVPLDSAAGTWPAGAFLVRYEHRLATPLKTSALELGQVIVRLPNEPEGDRIGVSRPRIGIYQAWGGNMDEGWTRWVLEQYGFSFETVHDDRVRAGDLASTLDVLVLPSSSWSRMLNGLEDDTYPPDYTGGMTPAGVLNLYAFVRAGGTLVAMDLASELPLTLFGLPIRDVASGRRNEEFFIPGSILQLETETDHPLAWGVPAETPAFFARSPAFAVGRRATRFERQRGVEPPAPANITIAARWAEDDLLLSGWALGEKVISGRAAVVEAEVGDGRVVLLGLRAQHRGQPLATFKLLFNALLR